MSLIDNMCYYKDNMMEYNLKSERLTASIDDRHLVDKECK